VPDLATWLAGTAILVGLAGIVLPILPGLALVVLAALGWAVQRQDGAGWVVVAVVVLLALVGQVGKYLLPGRRLRRAGVPARTLISGSVLGVVGFFVVPVVGVFVGFVLGVYLAELARLGSAGAAWPSTRQALAAAGWATLIELATGLMVALTWLLAVLTG
jgi:uncharacterized protein